MINFDILYVIGIFEISDLQNLHNLSNGQQQIFESTCIPNYSGYLFILI